MASDIINTKYNNLTIKNFCSPPTESMDKKKNSYKWVYCECECGNFIKARLVGVMNGNNKSCGCLKNASKNNSKCFTGYEDISGKFWSQIERTAKGGTNKRKRICKDFAITIQYAWKVFIGQDRKCALTDEPLYFASGSDMSDGNASLDRIDSNLGYVEGNIQWVSKTINIMKNKFNQDLFIDICNKVSKKHNTK